MIELHDRLRGIIVHFPRTLRRSFRSVTWSHPMHGKQYKYAIVATWTPCGAQEKLKRLPRPSRESSGGHQERLSGTQEQPNSFLERHGERPRLSRVPFCEPFKNLWQPSEFRWSTMATRMTPKEGPGEGPETGTKHYVKWFLKLMHLENPEPPETRSRPCGVRFVRKQHVHESAWKREQKGARIGVSVEP